MAKRKDAKAQALAEHAALNPHPQRVIYPNFAAHEFFDPRDIVQVKYEMIRCVRVDGHCVQQAAAAFGFSRPIFYQAQAILERDGLVGLIPKRRGPRQAHKLSDEVMAFIEQQIAGDPALRAPALAELIHKRFKRSVHPRSIERALKRRQKGG